MEKLSSEATCGLCMIVKDEESTLGRCLESVKDLFDEIIVVDTGSQDKTQELARRFTDKVFHFLWTDNFSEARNYAFSRASTDYAVWLDADDVIPPESYDDWKELLDLLDKEAPDMVYLPYNVGLDEAGQPSLTFERERLIRLGIGLAFSGAVHEAIPPKGKIIHGTAAVTHLGKKTRDSKRNLRIFQKLLDSGIRLSSREKYYYARELCYAGRLDEAKLFYTLCLEDPQAWIENRISSCIELGDLFLGKKETVEALKFYLKSLELSTPRSDVCCRLGRIFMERGSYDQAKFWYELAPSVSKDVGLSFVHRDYGGYIPYLQLTVIADRMGDTESAKKYNELAGSFKPYGREYLWNKDYFNSKTN